MYNEANVRLRNEAKKPKKQRQNKTKTKNAKRPGKNERGTMSGEKRGANGATGSNGIQFFKIRRTQTKFVERVQCEKRLRFPFCVCVGPNECSAKGEQRKH